MGCFLFSVSVSRFVVIPSSFISSAFVQSCIIDMCFGKLWMSLKSLVDMSNYAFGNDPNEIELTHAHSTPNANLIQGIFSLKIEMSPIL